MNAEHAEQLDLVEGCLAGDSQAARGLVERFHQRVVAFCWRMVGDRHEAEDLAQETFVRALRGLAGWDPTRRFEPWLLTIAANRCRTSLSKRHRRQSAVPMEPVLEPSELVARGNAADTDHHLAEELELALEEMRDEYRQAFELFHREELPYTVIAARLSVPLGTAKTWVHRARHEIADRFVRRGVLNRSPLQSPASPVSP